MEPCGTPLCSGMAPECSPATCTLKTRPERYASVQRTTTSPRAKDFILAKRNLWFEEYHLVLSENPQPCLDPPISEWHEDAY